ncbi:PPOX class F420-dependent oxidoreductase [Phytohabitans houttuyneae]|uniref:PPOX class F420-dependent oxidoreductase n=1 Tax=Phytohabitans houttuyneae TaxID=1076126 RepID=A0A6V8KM56_9ACTN|nr:PPOX class F420-dependent oxidoreductase [Phytohabitans houttuyneae]GFJ83289.1 PPOX class F420-dependent oxidoreductase [Phytohabitans houttuyneae]
MSALDRLADESYVLLTTFRKDGRAVATPVWSVRDGDALAVWSVADAGKVKRIRRSGAVTVAPCDFRGNPRGDAVSGHATLTGSAHADEHIRRLMARKYGLVGRITMLGSRIRRGRDGTVGIRITFEA